MEGAAAILYGFDGKSIKKLRPLCVRMGLRLRQVRPEEAGQPVGAFAGVAEFRELPAPGTVPGTMLVLAGLTDRQVDAFLSAMRTARVGQGSLKAVLTPTNKDWTGPQIYAELHKEREAMGDSPIHPAQEEISSNEE